MNEKASVVYDSRLGGRRTFAGGRHFLRQLRPKAGNGSFNVADPGVFLHPQGEYV